MKLEVESQWIYEAFLFLNFFIMEVEVHLFVKTNSAKASINQAYYYALGVIYSDLSDKKLKTVFEFNLDDTDYLVKLESYDLLEGNVSLTIEC